MQLRNYQKNAVDAVIAGLDRRPILVAPTGSGKTVMASALVERFDRPTLWLAHRKELIEQAAARLEKHGLHVGLVMAGCGVDAFAKVQVGSVQTLVRRKRGDWPAAQLIVMDECHHATAGSYMKILDRYPHAHVVGLTATPFRLDGGGLGDIFNELVVAAYTDELCNKGFLHAPRVYASQSPDLHGVKTLAGDYQLNTLAKRSNTVELTGDIVATWRRRAAGKRTVAFAVNVEHSQAIVAAFRAAGVPAEHLDGKTPGDERSAMLARLRDGHTQVVSNCLVLTEGWDLPALECAILARPTASLNLHLQMIGRVMRACEGKDGAIVLDHAGNHHTHGPVTRRLAYSLDQPQQVQPSEPLNLTRCCKCGLMYPPTAVRCPECGHTSAPKPRRIEVHGETPLVCFDDSSFEYRKQAWRNYEAQRIAYGFKSGWSYHRFEDRFGHKPLVVHGELVDPHCATSEQKRAYFEQLAALASERDYKRGWASWKFREAFGHWPRGFVKQVREALATRELEAVA